MMRRTITLFALVPLLVGLLSQPGGVSAAPAAVGVNDCGVYLVGDPTLGGNYQAVFEVNRMTESCEGHLSFNASATYKGYSLELFANGNTHTPPVQGTIIVNDPNGAGVPGIISMSAPPNVSVSGKNGLFTKDANLTFRLQPDYSAEGSSGTYSAKITLNLFQIPGPTATASPTASTTAAPATTPTPTCTNVPVTGNYQNQYTATYSLTGSGTVSYVSGSGTINSAVGIALNGTYIGAVAADGDSLSVSGPGTLGFSLGQQGGTTTVRVCETIQPTATINTTATPSAANCDGVSLAPGTSCSTTISGYDVVAAKCSGSFGEAAQVLLTASVDGGSPQAYTYCDLTSSFVVRVDKKSILITLTNQGGETRTPHFALNAYNDIKQTINGAGGGDYYNGQPPNLGPLVNFELTINTPSSILRTTCTGNFGNSESVSVNWEIPKGANSALEGYCDQNLDKTGGVTGTTIIVRLTNGKYDFGSERRPDNLHIWGEGTLGVTSTPTRVPSATFRPASTWTATRTATGSPTTTPTTTPTVTGTPPVAGECALSTTYNVPVAPGVITITLNIGVRFVVADNPIKINYGPNAIDINPGSYQWQQASADYVLYSLTGPARLLLCVGDKASATPAAATLLPTNDPATGDCYPATPVPGQNPAAMPDLALILPTWTPTIVVSLTMTVTATNGVSLTAIISVIGTASTGIISPAAQLQTAVAPYSYASGQTTAASWTSTIAPALDWLAIINPQNPVWVIEGGPLWAIKPIVWPLLPIIVISVLVALGAFLLWLGKLLLAVLDILFKLIELIPGE